MLLSMLVQKTISDSILKKLQISIFLKKKVLCDLLLKLLNLLDLMIDQLKRIFQQKCWFKSRNGSTV